jgi:probable F420-dependent oxidoreductase
MAPRPFRFGVINELMYPPAEWLAQVRHIEELGYATFLLRDHFVPDFFGDQYAPIAALSAAANATRTLRVGTMVIDNDYRHPVMLAKEAATLDVFSGGRFELGMGAGWLRGEYEQAGIAFDSAGARIGRLEEALQIVKGLWAGDPLTFEGRHYRIQALAGVPRPAQRPGPPILVGGGHRRMLTLAGRVADSVGILTTSVATGTLVADPRERMPDAVAQKIAWVREGAGSRFGALELSLIPSIAIADHRRQRTEQWLAEQGWSGLAPEDVWAMPSVFIGSVDQIVEDMLDRRERYGFSYYVIDDSLVEDFAPIVRRLAGK